jgi:serine/threonine protein kinase
MPVHARDFAGTERFELRHRLGEGGMGVVYEAFDRERGTRVALKTLRDLDEALNAELVLRFKNEFRSLQDLQHPNLVSLGELIEDSGHWFFTMELLDGVDFLAWVRPGMVRPVLDTSPTVAESPHLPLAARITREDGAPLPIELDHTRPLEELPPLDEGRLREALRQLVAGLCVLHRAGKVHRDIKPNNILVQPDGRLVLLDFGLVTESTREVWIDEGVVGTTGYMAPEQAASKPVGPEADCYAVGVVLFEALTGQLPFTGSTMKVLVNKQREDPPPPSLLCPTVPPDLDRLCVELLRYKPSERPTAPAILNRLGGVVTPTASVRSWTVSQSSLFVGREAELAQLHGAFADMRLGQTATLLVAGESGVGKTALARRFVRAVRATHGDAVVLSARCYERESVPFKAFDGIVDALSNYMVSLPDADAAVLLPMSASLLTQVFPVLRRVRAMAKAPRPRHEVLDPQQLRMRVFMAMRELLTRLADRRPLILLVDDFQWADRDSVALLGEVTRPPDAPRLLLLLIATAQAGESGAALAAGLDARRVTLTSLSGDEARQLAARLARHQGADPSLAEAIAADANGHPLFIDELIRHATAHGVERPAPVHLDAALRERIGQLEPQERRLLELVAVAGGRLAQETVARASAMPPTEFDKRLASLRVANLVMTKGERRTDAVEPYHDRVRRAVLAHLDDNARREHHEQLALALEASGRADPESLAAHWRGAGEIGHAAKYAVLAADRSARAFAFDRAASLYRLALELGPTERDPRQHALQLKLAEALVNAGRGADAAAAYLTAADYTVGNEQLDLKRRAAEQLLRCGHIDEALDLYRTIQRALGMPLAETPARAVVSLLAQRMRIRLRGLRFKERDETQLTRRDLSRIDTGFFVGLGLTTVDTIRGADLMARQLLLALDAGEPYRVARAVAVQAALNAASNGAAGHARTAALVEMAQAIATRIDHPHALGLAAWAAGTSAYLEGRWHDGHALNDRALAIYRDRCTGVAWEAASARAFSLWSLYYLGELAEIGRRLPSLIKQARDRGDLYDATNLRTSHTNIWWLAVDDPARAAAEAGEAIREWSPKGFHLQHYYELSTLAQCDLYEGRALAAHQRVLGRWAQMKRALLFEIVAVKVEMLFLRARTALAAAAQRPAERAVLLASAAEDARHLAEAKMPWARAVAVLIDACLAAAAGHVEVSCRRFGEAAFKLNNESMRLLAACARRRQGELLGGDEGAALVAEAESWMHEQRIVQPARICALHVPWPHD